MAKNKTRACIVCGKEYIYCNNCNDYAKYPAWMAIYHDENCKDIMTIATEYMAGNLSKAEAKTKLDKCDLSNRKNFSNSVTKAIDEIFTEKKPAKIEPAKNTKQTGENI